MAADESRLDIFRETAVMRSELRRFLRRSEIASRQHGLSPRHYELLLMVKAADGGQVTVGELVKQLHLSQSTVTELVQRAEEKGLLKRVASDKDGRVTLLSLTAEAEKRLSATVEDLGPERDRLRAVTAGLSVG